MCITRVGRIVSLANGKAVVQFFDSNSSGDVDVSMLKVEKDAYVEVFANLALSRLSRREAEERRKAWVEIRRAAMAAHD